MPYLELVFGSVSMVRSDVRSCLLLDLMLSGSRNACDCLYVRVFFAWIIYSSLKMFHFILFTVANSELQYWSREIIKK